MEKDISTEEKIKDAARKMFQEKGYGLTRTRDIADAAGINLALLNYYYRSKEKLFDIIMAESLQQIFSFITHIINDETTTLSQKIDIATNRYIDELLVNPNLPIFVLSEIQAHPQKFLQKVGVKTNMMPDSLFYKQMEEQLRKEGLDQHINALHIFVNMVSLSIFPLVAKPLLTNLYVMADDKYSEFIDSRRILIPQWIKAMLNIKD